MNTSKSNKIFAGMLVMGVFAVSHLMPSAGYAVAPVLPDWICNCYDEPRVPGEEGYWETYESYATMQDCQDNCQSVCQKLHQKDLKYSETHPTEPMQYITSATKHQCVQRK